MRQSGQSRPDPRLPPDVRVHLQEGPASAMAVHRMDGSEPLAMGCDLCGAQSPFDDGLPFVNQTASFATDHGCGDAGSGGDPGQDTGAG